MVMIHAGICDRRMWQAQMTHFAARYRVVSYDMRGFGESAMVGGSFALHNDLRAVLDALAIERAWLLACSLGGKVALDLTLSNPQRVQGLLLSGPAISGYQYTGAVHPLAADIDAADDAGDMQRLNELELQMWVAGEGRTLDDVDPAVVALVRDMNGIALAGDEALWDEKTELEPPALGRLAEIDVPTLILVGDLDVAASLERAELCARQIAGAQKNIIAGTAHLPNLEQPVRFNQLVDNFLATASA